MDAQPSSAGRLLSFCEKDEDAPLCGACRVPFGILRRRHHCRQCGYIFCHDCSSNTFPLPPGHEFAGEHVRLCDRCHGVLAQEADDLAGRQHQAAEHERRELLRQMDRARECYHESQAEVARLVREEKLQLGPPLAAPPIGTRSAAEKSYHLCSTPAAGFDMPEGRAVVTLMRLPVGSAINASSSGSIAALERLLLRGTEHPFVHTLRAVVPAFGGRALVTARDLVPLGSLKDALHRQTPPLVAASSKYLPATYGSQWPLKRVRLLARQILEALCYLRYNLGLPCASVHTGNVLMITEKWCQVSEVRALHSALPLSPGTSASPL